MKKKNLMAKKIQKIFFRYQQLKILRKLFKSIRRIQTLFKVKNEYKKFKETQKKIRFLQKFVKHKILKKKIIELFENISKQKKTVTKITAFYRMKSASRKFKKIINSANLIKNKFCSYLKNKTNKIRRDCNELVRKIIFEAAWLKIRFKIETFAAITIQKYMRSYLTRKEFADFVKKINKKKYF